MSTPHVTDIPPQRSGPRTNFHCALQCVKQFFSLPIPGRHTLLDALDIVDEELTLDTVVDSNTEVGQVEDDEPQHTECFKSISLPTIRKERGEAAEWQVQDGREINSCSRKQTGRVPPSMQPLLCDLTTSNSTKLRRI